MESNRIDELFGEYSSDELDELFVWGSSKSNSPFERIGRSYNTKEDVALFVIKHKETGEFFGLVEYNLDSWAENSSTAYEQGYPIYKLIPEEVTITQYSLNGPPTYLD